MAGGDQEAGRPWRRRRRKRRRATAVINCDSHGGDGVMINKEKKRKTAAAAAVASSSSTAAAEVDWSSGVPGDILCVVVMKLRLPDLSSFARVCRRWRSAAMESKAAYVSSLAPLLRLDWTRRRYSYDAFYSMADRRYYRIKRGGGEEPPPPPPPPPRGGSEQEGRIIRRDDAVCTFSCGYWMMRSAPPPNKGHDNRFFLADPLTGRVVPGVCFPPAAKHNIFTNYGFLTAPPGSPDCALVAMYTRAIWWCRPGDATWSKHYLARPLHLESVDGLSAVVGGKLYAVSQTGSVLAFSFPHKGITVVRPRLAVRVVGAAAPPEQATAYCRWLVESEGRLLSVALLEKQGEAPARFVVHQLEEEEEGSARWVAVRDLGLRALLLSMYRPACCNVPSTALWGGAAPNSIYWRMSPRVLGIYHLGDGRTELVPTPNYEDMVLPALCASFEFWTA